ncbi:hypothetical protein J437_LFUL018089 [Ladona fulva]|uniref:Uncharacterized protein n=1 Tax=Ladona fulva TaxID=123851 RepID=A0A8K0KT29_LADFU|nr:hypothetical protein J437_LFUL018089 [Ladona fulva]
MIKKGIIPSLLTADCRVNETVRQQLAGLLYGGSRLHRVSQDRWDEGQVAAFSLCIARAKQWQGVYGVTCDCGLTYIRETDRMIETRLKEHSHCIHLQQPSKLEIAEHTLKVGHRMEFDNGRVLSIGMGYWDHIAKEAIEAHRENMNRDKGYNLSKCWNGTIRIISQQRQERTNQKPICKQVEVPEVGAVSNGVSQSNCEEVSLSWGEPLEQRVKSHCLLTLIPLLEPGRDDVDGPPASGLSYMSSALVRVKLGVGGEDKMFPSCE